MGRDLPLVHVVVTGLKLRSWWRAPIFWRHALPSFRQAQRASGCLRARARTVAGVQHTLTVWETPAAARAYAGSGAHARAMRAFPGLATGGIVAWDAPEPPDWNDALARCQANAAGPGGA